MTSLNLSEYDEKNVPKAQWATIGIVVSQWNRQITESMFKGAKETLLEFQVKEKKYSSARCSRKF